MTTSHGLDPDAVTERAATAASQTLLLSDQILHSGNSGVVIHRAGAFHYEFAQEGYGFSVDLLDHLNSTQAGVATTFCYEEAFGTHEQVHWLIHLRSLDEYKHLVHAVDHDPELQAISLVDRLPEKGHGNWERIFIENSITERVMVPQHGFNQFKHAPYDRDAYYAAPAQNQTAQKLPDQLNSATAGAIILRTGNVKYAFREEGRLYWYDWQEYVNAELPGIATCFMYEETFGTQDRVHMLIHLRDLSDYRKLTELDRGPGMHERIHTKQRVHDNKGGGTWEQLFLSGSIKDTVLIPRTNSATAGPA
jgi:hypothetical protein